MTKDRQKYMNQLPAPVNHAPKISTCPPMGHSYRHLHHPAAQTVNPHSQGSLNAKPVARSQLLPD